jgi:hypothetical protein
MRAPLLYELLYSILQLRTRRKHDLPAAKAAGKSALVARDDEAGFSCLGLLARTQRNEVAVAFEDAIDLGLVSHAVTEVALMASLVPTITK